MTHEHRLRVFSEVISRVASEWPSKAVGAHDPKLWGKLKSLYPHVISLRDIYMKYFSGDLVNGHIPLASLIFRASWYQIERGGSHNIRTLLELGLDLCVKCSDRDSLQVQDLEGDINCCLGAVANETNDAESCLEYNKRYLEIQLNLQRKSELPVEKLPRAYNQMGTAWMMTREYEKAESSFSNSMAGFRALPIYDMDMMTFPMANIGLAYWLQGRLDDAAAVLEEGLNEREEAFGVMDRRCFRSEQFHVKALTQYKSTLGAHHHRTADVCHKVAQHCLRNGQKEEAYRLTDQALNVWAVDESAYRPEIARTTFLKAKVAWALERETDALNLYRKAAKLRRKLTNQHKKHDQLSESEFDELVTFWSR
ncbi:hypothetical protein PG997_005756 [Apiospora hydei]|uniref:Tetratricopeptide repeat protein n=1 Tax=Apiospora hydei TaxID=1337664 RepID=A0ABR1WPU0_9PEZI